MTKADAWYCIILLNIIIPKWGNSAYLTIVLVIEHVHLHLYIIPCNLQHSSKDYVSVHCMPQGRLIGTVDWKTVRAPCMLPKEYIKKFVVMLVTTTHKLPLPYIIMCMSKFWNKGQYVHALDVAVGTLSTAWTSFNLSLISETTTTNLHMHVYTLTASNVNCMLQLCEWTSHSILCTVLPEGSFTVAADIVMSLTQ